MKFDWNKKYNTIAIYAIIVLVISIIFYLAASEVGLVKLQIGRYLSVFHPIIIGLVMAYLFNFVLNFYEKYLVDRLIKNSENKRFRRPIGMVFTYLTIITVLVLFINFILPQLVSSVGGLVNKIPLYVQDISDTIADIDNSFNIPEEISEIVMGKWDEFLGKIIEFGTNLVPKIGNFARSILSSIWNIVLGVIVSIYLLMEKEKFQAVSKKVLASIFSEKNNDIALELFSRADTIFGKFISGKILDSIIIGILTFAVLKLFKMPYTLLISFIIGITNIIPFFGPFIGAVPSFFIILFESPIKAFTFLIIILVIQQIDGNIIGPKILGDSLGISAFWILFSLLVAGKLLGFIGLIIGVPLFVFIYSIIKDIVEYRLEKKGLPIETKKYYKE